MRSNFMLGMVLTVFMLNSFENLNASSGDMARTPAGLIPLQRFGIRHCFLSSSRSCLAAGLSFSCSLPGTVAWLQGCHSHAHCLAQLPGCRAVVLMLTACCPSSSTSSTILPMCAASLNTAIYPTLTLTPNPSPSPTPNPKPQF